MTEKPKRVDYEMKYIGWNMGATRVERHETKGDIELLELTIDGIDVLKQLEKAEKWERLSRHLHHGPGWVIDSITTDGWGEVFGAWKKLEDAKNWLTKAKAEGRISMSAGFSLGLVLGVEE